ncbi:hypothetical protein [Micromonospora sp. 4G55]|uniref:hypothetical protein n=1 Tax=Micromonospora sp. 4G55 TaxID=2806102 RepID=UPI001A5EBA51|nr:hypothetical protein [Micromonospora sp. 4G55]MBM0257504.1 hypothetical protein [Micromonospora sp. 4G55]
MADGNDPAVNRTRRVGRGALPHLLAMVIFGLLAWSGGSMLRQGVDGLAVPSLMIGAAGAVGALLMMARRPSRHADESGPDLHQLVRVAMVLVALTALVTGTALAPDGMDRGFVISVDAVLAGALASYALLAGEQRVRPGCRAERAPHRRSRSPAGPPRFRRPARTGRKPDQPAGRPRSVGDTSGSRRVT